MAAFGSAAKYFDEIVAKIEAGAPRAEVLASNPEYPTARSLYNHARKTGQLDRWRIGEDQRGKCEEHFDSILMAIRGGLSTRQALASNPDFPNHNCLCAYLRKYPHQRFRLDEAVRAGAEASQQIAIAKRHLIEILDRIAGGMTEAQACEGIVAVHNFRGYVDRNPDARIALDRAREERERSGRSRMRRRLRTYTEQDYESVLSAIRSARGKSIRRVFDALPADLPGRHTVYQRVKRDPAFAARFGEACRGRKTKVAKTSGDLASIIEKLVPKHLDPAARDDIKSEICLAVLTGEIAQADIAKSVKEFTKRHNKNFSAWEFASLDKPLGDDSDFSLGDMATSNAEVW